MTTRRQRHIARERRRKNKAQKRRQKARLIRQVAMRLLGIETAYDAYRYAQMYENNSLAIPRSWAMKTRMAP